MPGISPDLSRLPPQASGITIRITAGAFLTGLKPCASSMAGRVHPQSSGTASATASGACQASNGNQVNNAGWANNGNRAAAGGWRANSLARKYYFAPRHASAQ